MRVHQAVLASNAPAPPHIVTAERIRTYCLPGSGSVKDDDTPQSLADRVLQVEHRIYPEALRLLAEELIEVDGLRTRLKTKPN